MLDNRYALLFIRGERPVMDEKYDILKHPNIALTEDGGAAPYEHGGTENAIATLSFAGAAAETISAPNEQSNSAFVTPITVPGPAKIKCCPMITRPSDL